MSRDSYATPPLAGLKRVLLATSATADDRKTLAALRSLASRGIAVTVGSSLGKCLPRHSRFCSGFVRYPEPADDAAAFASALCRYLESSRHDAVLALCDYTTHAVASAKDQLLRLTGLCVPDVEPLVCAGDKAWVLELADSLGIGIPKTLLIRGPGDLDLACSSVGWPCVLKLRRGAGGVGRSYCDSPASLRRAYHALTGESDIVYDFREPLVQEHVPGEIHDVCALFCRGEPRAVLSQKRLAMQPAEGGVGIHNETTREPALIRQAVELLSALHWHGPAQVEFKCDARDGRMRLMEINPRFWGTLDLAIQAGVDFPFLAATIAAHGDVEAVDQYKVGMRMRWMFCYESPARPVAHLQGRAFLDALRGDGLNRTDLWLTDPLPHIIALFQGGSELLNKFLARRPATR